MNHYMKDYEEQLTQPVSFAFAYSALMRKVYLWMTLALAVSGLTAYYVAGNEQLLLSIYSHSAVLWGLVIAELVMVFALSAAIQKMSFPVAACLFAGYSILNGVTLASIFVIYTATSIATTFFVTAGTFGAMALVGTITKRDLSKLGSILLMALIGLIIAAVVNIFLRNSMLDLVVSAIGVLIFVGLTAYDAQKIRLMMEQVGYEVNDQTQKLAVLGALNLYLDFINLFLYLLRFLGNRND